MALARSFVFYLAVFLLIFTSSVKSQKEEVTTEETSAEVNGEIPSQNEKSEQAEDTAKPKETAEEEEKEPEFLEADPKNWGSYYDPQQIFCGKYDCYRILGFDYESFGRDHPSTKEITKRYRRVSRRWHPDKSKHPKAKERFVKIVRAYEVLTDNEKRKEYDFMRYNQEAYFQKYGTSVLWTYAPKSDVLTIIVVILVLLNVFSWYAQKTKWQNVADRLVKAAIEEWSPSQGGSRESKELREHAIQILAEREVGGNDNNSTADDKSASAKKKKKKLTGKEKKEKENEALLPILKELVDEMDDFGGGFHKPTWEDFMIVSMMRFPYRLAVGAVWEAKYMLRRLQKKELSAEEKEVLTQRAVGPVVWDLASEDDRQGMITRELWVLTNLAEWKEEEELKNLSASERKAIKKMQKEESKKGKKQQ